MSHSTSLHTQHANRLIELRALRPGLKIFEDDCHCGESCRVKILDQRNTPFWYAVFNTELDAREAYELWVALKHRIEG